MDRERDDFRELGNFQLPTSAVRSKCQHRPGVRLCWRWLRVKGCDVVAAFQRGCSCCSCVVGVSNLSSSSWSSSTALETAKRITAVTTNPSNNMMEPQASATTAGALATTVYTHPRQNTNSIKRSVQSWLKISRNKSSSATHSSFSMLTRGFIAVAVAVIYNGWVNRAAADPVSGAETDCLHAVTNSELDIIDSCIRDGHVNAASADGESLLHVSAIRGNVEV